MDVQRSCIMENFISVWISRKLASGDLVFMGQARFFFLARRRGWSNASKRRLNSSVSLCRESR